VADAVAGVADPETGRPVTPDTPFYCYSVGKGATSTVAHGSGLLTVGPELGPQIDDRRVVAEETPLDKHVRHALTHTVGVPGIPADTTPEDLCDWDKMCAAIADAEPWWEPGTKIAYHAYPFGYIVGEIVRRTTGKPISRVLREEVAAPLGITDEIYFGVPESELSRLAKLEDMEGSAQMLASMPDDSPFFKLGPRQVTPTAEFGNRHDILMADIPAGGKMSARAVARMYAALVDEVDGVRLVPPARLREISSGAVSGVDEIMGFPTTWALGYSVGRLGADPQETKSVLGSGGVGGSFACADTATGVTWALTKNRLTAGFEAAEQISEIVTKAVEED
jgi:CubicO group peptidase (beta-lactamase class C family)